MGTRVRLLVLALLGALLAALALPPVPTATARPGAARAADPPTRVLAPLSLGRGPDAAVDFLQDGVIHAAGRTIAVRAPANREQRQLLGRAPGHGWLVAVRKGYVGRVLSVRPGRAPKEVRRTRFTTYGQGDSSVGWLLSDDGAMLVSTLFDRGGTTYRAQDLDGHGLGGGYDTAYFNPWDADGGHVVTYAENKFYRLRVVDWSPRTSRTEIAKAVSYVSLRDDLMFARTTGRLYGPTPVSAPATPPWAEPFAPLAVSPDGATAIGLRLADRKSVV